MFCEVQCSSPNHTWTSGPTSLTTNHRDVQDLPPLLQLRTNIRCTIHSKMKFGTKYSIPWNRDWNLPRQVAPVHYLYVCLVPLPHPLECTIQCHSRATFTERRHCYVILHELAAAIKQLPWRADTRSWDEPVNIQHSVVYQTSTIIPNNGATHLTYRSQEKSDYRSVSMVPCPIKNVSG